MAVGVTPICLRRTVAAKLHYGLKRFSLSCLECGEAERPVMKAETAAFRRKHDHLEVD